MDINGFTFYTMTQDKKSVYKNSGLRVRAVIDDSHDDDDDMKKHILWSNRGDMIA
jgi:hypothetical protein